MIDRRRHEIELLQKKYGVLEVGSSLNYVLFKEFRLPEGWNREYIELLVLIPGGYPITPPDNFYVTPGLRTKAGSNPGSYSEGQNHIGRIWGVFSVHVNTNTWSPLADNLLEGSNLLTYIITVVEKRLSEVN